MADALVVSGAREHNLKNITVAIPRDRLVVITGLSGSGKSSLAFDTIYAEGQRRYVESLSAYARQFLEQMEKPDVDSIEGLSPAIAIEQKSTSKNPRSTVGTVTEIYDYLRLLFARIGTPHCPQCGRAIAPQTVSQIVDRVMALPERSRVHILAPIVRGRKGEYRKELLELRKAGFVRVRVDGQMRDLAEDIALAQHPEAHHRGAGRPPGHPSRHRGAPGRLARRGVQVRQRRRQRRRARRARRRARERNALQPAFACSRLRHLVPRDHAAAVLIQQPARRVPDLQRARHHQCTSIPS